MITVATDNLEPGMTLSADVLDVNSRLLLSKGLKIQPKHIRVFKIWGVTEVPIEGKNGRPDPSAVGVTTETANRVIRETRRVFSHQDLGHPATKELFRQAVYYRSQMGSTDRTNPATEVQQNEKKGSSNADIMKKLEGSQIKLPELPAIINELNEVIARPNASATDIARIVDKSASLVTVLLKIVNSALYTFPSPIDSISRAVTLIGSKEITSLAVGISVMRMFKNIPNDLVDIRSFMRHSLACGIISRILAARKNIPETEKLFVSGLLHDIGRLVLYKYFQEESQTLLIRARSEDVPLHCKEQSILGCRHTTIARHILKKWRLSSHLMDSVFYHHTPSSADLLEDAAIVHISDIIVNALGMGSSGEFLVPYFDTDAWDRVGLSPSILNQVIRQSLHQLGSLENILTVEK